MGMGVAGMMTLLVMKWIIPHNSLRLAPVSQPSSYWGIPMTPNMSCFMIHPSSNARAPYPAPNRIGRHDIAH